MPASGLVTGASLGLAGGFGVACLAHPPLGGRAGPSAACPRRLILCFGSAGSGGVAAVPEAVEEKVEEAAGLIPLVWFTGDEDHSAEAHGREPRTPALTERQPVRPCWRLSGVDGDARPALGSAGVGSRPGSSLRNRPARGIGGARTALNRPFPKVVSDCVLPVNG